MSSMNTCSSDILFMMLRISLGNESTCSIPSMVDWRDVMQMAERQGVLGVAFDALSTIRDNQGVIPDMDILMDWIGQVSYMESYYEQYKKSISTLSAILQNHGLKMMVMKGFGCSLNYPNPSHRPCGDIDIWMYGRYEEGNSIFENEGINVDRDNSHHSTFHYDGQSVENHITILDVKRHKSNIYLESLLEKLAEEENNQNTVCSSPFMLPSAKFNSVHLLRHMASDFATVHTTLRHLLDWATFISKYSDLGMIDWALIKDVACQSNMMRFLNAINSICVDFLGYPSEMFPIEEYDKSIRDKVLNDILYNTDQIDIPSKDITVFDKIQYGIKKTRRIWKNRWKYSMVYDESLLSSFVQLAKNRWNNN